MEENFKIADDGTIDRTYSYNADIRARLNKEILEVNSYSKGLLSTYKGRKLANAICKEKYYHKNYKEYVEMLMHKNYPQEAEKARLGASFVLLNWITIPLFLNSIFWSIYFISEITDDYVLIPIVPTILIFYIIKMINIQKKIRSLS